MIGGYSREVVALFVAAAAVSFFTGCETQRTVKSTRSSISFDSGVWGAQGQQESATSKEDYKIADSGWEIDENGVRTAKRPNLHSGQTARGLDGEYGTKKARFKKDVAKTKEYKTPEYLKMQEYRGAEEARESNSNAREGLFKKSREAGKSFDTDGSEKTNEMALFKTGSTNDTGSTYKTGEDRIAMDELRTSPRADGVQQISGYKPNSSMTVDDVKKMLNPGAYTAQSD